MEALIKYSEDNKVPSKGSDIQMVFDIIRDIREKYKATVSLEENYKGFSSEEIELKGKIHSLLERRFWFREFADYGNAAVFMVEQGSGDIIRGLRNMYLIQEKEFYVTEEDDVPKSYLIREKGKDITVSYRDFAYGRISVPIPSNDYSPNAVVSLLKVMLELSHGLYLSNP